MTPLDVAQRALEVRNQRLQNEILSEELRRLKAENEVRSTVPAHSSSRDTGLTDKLPNGRLWRRMLPAERAYFLIGYTDDITDTQNRLDKFYAEVFNLPIPITRAVMLVALEAGGASSTVMAAALAQARHDSH